MPNAAVFNRTNNGHFPFTRVGFRVAAQPVPDSWHSRMEKRRRRYCRESHLVLMHQNVRTSLSASHAGGSHVALRS